jgi:signal transduction histidine kinase
LEFRYTGLSFTAPEKVRFRFRLAGVDRDWVEAGTQRAAVYQYLPPGEYVFQVTACNNDGVWNPAGARVAFVVEPFVWQTWWFRMAAAAVGAAGIAAGVAAVARARLRRKLERLERQQALERERARIAKDMHDELGASLTRITLLSQTARAELEDPQAVAEGLDRIYTTARELTRALDEIVWAVNPHHDTLDSLATYLGRFAQEFLAAARVRCRLDVPVHLPAWPLTAEVRHNLFLAFKEALHNAVKHSGASEVRVVLETDADGFVLRVEDDGCGFTLPTAGWAEAESSSARGNGLRNMHQRLRDIRGRCEIESMPGQGTRVRFRVPVPP